MTGALAYVSSQNCTKAVPAAATLRTDVLLTQERPSRWSLTRALRAANPGADWQHWFPRADRGVSVSVAREVFVVAPGGHGYKPFHKSGRAEGWDYRTPAHGLAYVEGTWAAANAPGAIATFHLLPDWTEPGQQWRGSIVRMKCLPAIRRQLDKWHREGRTVLLAGDSNAAQQPLQLPGMWTVKGRGMDRMWMTRDQALVLEDLGEGPRVGVGDDFQHQSVLATFRVRR